MASKYIWVVDRLADKIYQIDRATGTIVKTHTPSATIHPTYKTAKIDHGASGANAIVAAVTGKVIKVYSVVLVVTGAVNCKWQSASTDLTGAMNFNGTGEGYSQSVNPPAVIIQTAAGQALNLNLSAAVAVDGIVCYWDSDAA